MRRQRHAAFTLIELVVVMGIIILLAGLTVSVAVAVTSQSETRQTRATLLLLDAAVQAWELDADRKLTWWNHLTDKPKEFAANDVHSDTPHVLIITEVLRTIMKSPAARDAIARIDPRFIYTYKKQVYAPWIDTADEKAKFDARFGTGDITVLDAWGEPIYATHPGRTWVAATDSDQYYPTAPDADGTIRTYNEEIYGVATGRRMCFVSAGPDGQFGDLHHYALPSAMQEAQDNVYSYPVQPP